MPWNQLSMTLPERGMRGIASDLFAFLSAWNRFAGVLPAHGLRSMQALEYFGVGSNHFAGSVPMEGDIAASVIPTERPLELSEHETPRHSPQVAREARSRSPL
eukprot:574482-Amphidinium_carterae.1